MSDQAAAKFGAKMAAKGLSPEQVEQLVDKAVPVLDKAVQLADSGVPLDQIQFEIR
jgi:hypothetical protein